MWLTNQLRHITASTGLALSTDVASILVVDDDKTIRTLLLHIARRAGFDVDAAKDGIEALEMLAARQYDIAIVDLMMPRMSGYDLVQQISTMQPRPTVIKHGGASLSSLCCEC